MARNASRSLAAFVSLAFAALASAEPYLAVNKGMHCSQCHSHPAGGGKRNLYGNAFSQTELPVRRVGDGELWTGELMTWLSVGGNLRSEYRYVDTPNEDSRSAFDVTRGTVYAEASAIPNRLSLYLDMQVAPGGSLNREAYVRLTGASGRFSLFAGQFFLPYGLRLQDDSAFIRQATGVNFFNPDRGLQLAYQTGPWATQLSLTNGSGGSSENDSGKQVSWIGNYVRQNWRAGVSFNLNNSDAGDRQMQNVFFGLRTGSIAWLAEADLIMDDLPTGGTRDSVTGLLEANWSFLSGNNLKVSYDYFDPDRNLSDDQQVRWSLVWEYSPMQFLQGRFGARLYDGIPQIDAQNRSQFFAELHGFF